MQPDLAALIARVLQLGEDPQRRVILGIAGAPGAGKSTLAQALVQRLRHELGAPEAYGTDAVAHVPMDGFHLADTELRRLGMADRKGAPETFDAAGYRNLLQRLRERAEDVWAPAFDRKVEQPIAGSIPVPLSVRFVITEGNYLLLDADPWARVRTLLDEVWFCRLDQRSRLVRLTARHARFGKPMKDAAAWASGPDERNAELVAPTQGRADLVIEMD